MQLIFIRIAFDFLIKQIYGLIFVVFRFWLLSYLIKEWFPLP